MQTCFSYRTLFYIWHIIEYWCAPSVFLIFLVCFVLLCVGSASAHDQWMKLQIQLRTLIQHVFCYILQHSFESIVGQESILTYVVKWSCASVTLYLTVWFNYEVLIYLLTVQYCCKRPINIICLRLLSHYLWDCTDSHYYTDSVIFTTGRTFFCMEFVWTDLTSLWTDVFETFVKCQRNASLIPMWQSSGWTKRLSLEGGAAWGFTSR